MKTFVFALLYCSFNVVLGQNIEVVGNINTKGKIQVNGDSGIPGQVLTSNGILPPSWNSLIAQNIPSKVFVTLENNTDNYGRMVFNALTGAIQTDSIIIGTVKYNIGTDISVINSGTIGNRIVLNSTGLFRIEGSITPFVYNSSTMIHPVANIIFTTTKGSLFLSTVKTLPQIDFINPFGFSSSFPFGIDYYFEAGDSFTFVVQIAELTNFPQYSLGISSTGSFFSVSKISN